jgi:FkbM family methyltransferase
MQFKIVSDFELVQFAQSAQKNLDLSCTDYLGAHAGYWIYLLRQNSTDLKFKCYEANPLVWSRYRNELENLGNVIYKNLAVSQDEGPVSLYIPKRNADPETIRQRIDRKLFKHYHESSSRERLSWETEASLNREIIRVPHEELKVSTISLANVALDHEPGCRRKLLVTDLEGIDFSLLSSNLVLLKRYSAIMFEHIFDPKISIDDISSIMQSTFSSVGFQVICVNPPENSAGILNFLMVNGQSCNPRQVARMLEQRSKFLPIFPIHKKSIANRFAKIPFLSILLRLVSLFNVDVFTTR